MADALAAAGSFIFAFSLREGVSAFASDGSCECGAISSRLTARLLLFVVGIRLLSFRYCDLYRHAWRVFVCR